MQGGLFKKKKFAGREVFDDGPVGLEHPGAHEGGRLVREQAGFVHGAEGLEAEGLAGKVVFLAVSRGRVDEARTHIERDVLARQQNALAPSKRKGVAERTERLGGELF